MAPRLLYLTAGVAAGLLAASAAEAAPGWATGNVNMRTCASTSCDKITTIPAGAQVEVYGCPNWCDTVYAGYRGWVSSSYINVGGAPTPPPPVVVRPPIPPAAYWRYGRPWWVPGAGAWYDGRRYWYDGGWHRRPPRRSGFGIEFNF